MRRWSRRARALGETLVEVLQAELNALLADFHRTGKGAAKGVALLLLTCLFVFWSFGLLIVFAVALLAIWMKIWQAAGLVLLMVAVAGLITGMLSWRVLKKLRTPTRIIRIHVDDHLQWWRQTLASDRGETRVYEAQAYEASAYEDDDEELS